MTKLNTGPAVMAAALGVNRSDTRASMAIAIGVFFSLCKDTVDKNDSFACFVFVN
jgi:hypothetical protein